MAQVTLTSAMRTNLINLQQTNASLELTQTRLATGKKVNSALDNPTNFFSAAAHLTRANNLSNRKDNMTEAVQTVRAADAGVSGLKALLETAKGIVAQAATTSQSGLSALYTSFNSVATQIQQLVKDSGYKGTNFLDGTSVSLDVLFNETGTNKLTVNGFDALVSGLLASANTGVSLTAVEYDNLLSKMTNISSFTIDTGTGTSVVVGAAGFSNSTNLTAIDAGLTEAIAQLSANSSKLATSLAVINARLDFTNNIINVEKTGADNLTLADQNEEGANMLMLQTRNQLGTTSLSLASQAAQAILRLF